MFTQLDGRHPRRWDGDDSTADGDDHDFGEEAGWKTCCFSLCGKFSRNLRSRGRRIPNICDHRSDRSRQPTGSRYLMLRGGGMPRCPVPSSMPPLVQSSGHPSGGDGGLEQAIVGSRRRSCARRGSLMLKIINCDGHGDDGKALCVYKKSRNGDTLGPVEQIV